MHAPHLHGALPHRTRLAQLLAARQVRQVQHRHAHCGALSNAVPAVSTHSTGAINKDLPSGQHQQHMGRHAAAQRSAGATAALEHLWFYPRPNFLALAAAVPMRRNTAQHSAALHTSLPQPRPPTFLPWPRGHDSSTTRKMACDRLLCLFILVSP